MLSRPAGVADSDVIDALAAGWGFVASTVEYAAVGFGSYHWIATDAAGERRFVTVDVVDGDRLGELQGAFDTAVELCRNGLDFVIAPLPTTTGQSARRLDDRHSIAVLPFVEGVPGRFGRFPERAHREGVLDLLIELHQSSDPVRTSAPFIEIGLAERHAIVGAVHALDEPWSGGPYSERTREWLLVNAPKVARLVQRVDLLVRRVTAVGADLVITHGEPHPGNVMDTGDRLVLIDWDTVGLSLPERDLWLVADDRDERERYAEATGHRPDRNALELFALRWNLADIGIYLDLLRSPHVESADTEESWLGLEHALERARAVI